MSRQERAQLRAQQRRQDILSSALKIIAEKGYHAASVADMATDLQIGHGTFYRYFRNKMDIFEALISDIEQEVINVVRSLPPQTDSIEAYENQLQCIGQRLTDLFVATPEKAQVFFYEGLGSDPEVRRQLLDRLDRFAQLTAFYLENGVAKGFLRDGLDVRVTAYNLNAMIFEGIKQVARINAGRQEVVSPKEGDDGSEEDGKIGPGEQKINEIDTAQRWVKATIDLMLTGMRNTR